MKRIFLIFALLLLVGCKDNPFDEGGIFDLHHAGCIEVANSTEAGLTVYSKTGQNKEFAVIEYGATYRHNVRTDRLYDEYGRFISNAYVDVLIQLVDSENRMLDSEVEDVYSSRFDNQSGCAIINVKSKRYYDNNIRIEFW